MWHDLRSVGGELECSRGEMLVQGSHCPWRPGWGLLLHVSDTVRPKEIFPPGLCYLLSSETRVAFASF